MSTALYELSNDFMNILNVLETDEVQDEDLINRLESINEAIDTKAGNIAIVINTLIDECETIKAEIDRLKKRQESRENKIIRLKEYLKNNMMFCGKQKITSPTHTISIRNNYKTIVDDKFIEWAKEHDKKDLFTEKVTYTPDKKLIKEELESGNLDCPYVKIEETQSISIK